MTILFSAHNDDEALFACYTIMREKPLVVIVYDGHQHQRKFNVSIDQRRQESIEAMKLLGVNVEFLGFSDEPNRAKYEDIRELILKHKGDVYAPALGLNPQHNIVHEICKEFDDVQFYCTYDENDLLQKGRIEIVPTEEEKELKNKCLDCYTSQLKINPHHFDAVRNKNEYIK